MSGDYDVDGHLAQGRPAVDDIGEYVRACQQLGYHHPDLTVHPAQVRDVYSGEDGMRLDALAADVAALTAVAAAADDAVRRQSELVATLAEGWSGLGAGVALDFLTRHQRAAVTVSAAVRDAADAITALRDELWRAVDAKVSATLAVDASHQGQRAAWLAAARTVTTGAGDLASASELVDQQVKPFVDNDVRVDWLPAMRAASATVDAAYDAAIARVRGTPDAVFEVPGGLGPQWTAPVEHDDRVEGGGAVLAAPAAVVPAAVAPAALTPSPAPGPPLAPSAPLASEPTAAPAPPSLPPLGELGGTPSMGTPSMGTPSPGTGLSGFGQQLSDLLGGLTGAAGDASPELDPPELEMDEEPFDEDDPDDPDVEADEDDADEEDEDDESDAEDDAPTDPAAAAPEVPIEPDVPPEPAPEPTPTPVPAPMPEPGPQDVAAEPAGQTPCEIAADELPQIGE